MRISTKFPVAVHTLLLIAVGKEMSTSAWIAGSVNTNPVVIRRIVSHLQKAGLLSGNQGKSGYELMKSPSAITLLEIYKAVALTESDQLFTIHESPNIKCQVGASIHVLLETVMDNAQKSMEGVLSGVTLQDLINKIPEA